VEEFRFECQGARTSAAIYPAERPGSTLILAHGAGAPRTHPWMVRMANAIAARGADVVTFNFLYSEARRRVPDRNDVLEATWLAALDAVRSRCKPARLFVGGKSMGGRIATQVVAEGAQAKGVVLLGYPLHPPGKPDKLRSEHLPRVHAPMLFVQGERDAFGTPAELAPLVKGLARGTRVFVVEGGDHSLARPKASGETAEETIGRVADEVARFMAP
jgi:predicted alpha/beta-hydrolase family hydrolase